MLVWLRSSSGAGGSWHEPAGLPAGSAALLGRGQIKIIQRIAGRMGRGNVQRLEVVPLVFDLRARRRREKPSRPMMSLSSSIVCVIGWRWPSRSGVPGSAESNAWPATRCRRCCEPARLAAAKAASIAALTSLNRLPAAGLSAAGRRRALFAPL